MRLGVMSISGIESGDWLCLGGMGYSVFGQTVWVFVEIEL